VPTVQKREQVHDPRWAVLRPRPHPLPRSGWIDAAGSGVLDIVPDARSGAPKPAEWFRLPVPPGATAAKLPTDVSALRSLTVRLDGESVPVSGQRVELANPERERRVLEIRMEPTDGRTEGALWDGPITFECGTGRLSEGPWADAGLASYSGGVRYQREFEIDEGVREVGLDLGNVRGTVEVSVNGTPVGVRVWSPYRFDLTDAVRSGANDLRVTVFNTLGPYLDDASPTLAVFAGQRVSGLLGPARLVVVREETGEAGE
jgi:Glycosyl hydrolases family 2, sugar binding domain